MLMIFVLCQMMLSILAMLPPPRVEMNSPPSNVGPLIKVSRWAEVWTR